MGSSPAGQQLLPLLLVGLTLLVVRPARSRATAVALVRASREAGREVVTPTGRSARVLPEPALSPG